MRGVWAVVSRIIRSAYVDLLIGVSLVAAALFEASETFVEQILGVDIGVEHGVLLFGVVIIIIIIIARALENVVVGLEHLHRAWTGQPAEQRRAPPEGDEERP